MIDLKSPWTTATLCLSRSHSVKSSPRLRPVLVAHVPNVARSSFPAVRGGSRILELGADGGP